MKPLPTNGALITAAGRGHYALRPGTDDLQVTLEDGRHFVAPAELLSQQADGQYFLNLSLGDLRAQLQFPDSAHATVEEIVVPLVEEELTVGVREVETGRVRVTKVVREQEEAVETWLRRDEVEVTRETVNEHVEAASPVEYADDRVVIPIYEEVVVVEKRLLLKEKLVLTRRQRQAQSVQPVTRRVEEAQVERLPNDAQGGDQAEPGRSVL